MDFKELACGVSAACRGPEMERQKFCFKVFDQDGDGVLNTLEVKRMVESMMEVAGQGSRRQEQELLVATARKQELGTGQGVMEGLLKGKQHLSLDDYLLWTVDNHLPKEFAKLVFQVC